MTAKSSIFTDGPWKRLERVELAVGMWMWMAIWYPPTAGGHGGPPLRGIWHRNAEVIDGDAVWLANHQMIVITVRITVFGNPAEREGVAALPYTEFFRFRARL